LLVGDPSSTFRPVVKMVDCESTTDVILDKGCGPQKCIVGNRVGFFETKNRLCGVGFFDLTAAELRRLDEIWTRSRVT
jgi:hypothetical protein